MSSFKKENWLQSICHVNCVVFLSEDSWNLDYEVIGYNSSACHPVEKVLESKTE